MKRVIAVIVIMSLFLSFDLIYSSTDSNGNNRMDDKSEPNPSSYEKELSGNLKKIKSHWFGTAVLVTLGVAALATVLYFTVIKKPECKLTVTTEGVTGTPAAGIYTYKKGSKINYNYKANPGYKNLTVSLDSSPVGVSGTINMDKNHSLSATALEKGNYTSIKFRLRYILKSYNLSGVSKTVGIFNGKIPLSSHIGELHWALGCQGFILDPNLLFCDRAPLQEDVSVECEINITKINIRQQYGIVACDNTRDPVICTQFEIIILSYTWDAGKADPGSPQIININEIPVDFNKDFKFYESFGWICDKTTYLDFVPPSDPAHAQRVFVVSPCGER